MGRSTCTLSMISDKKLTGLRSFLCHFYVRSAFTKRMIDGSFVTKLNVGKLMNVQRSAERSAGYTWKYTLGNFKTFDGNHYRAAKG